MGQRVAIVGAGVAGLTAGYLLNKHHDITVFEKSDRIGGNAWTYRASTGDEVDIAVAAFGRAGYRHFFELLSRLKVKFRRCIRTYMSLHDLENRTGLYLTPRWKGMFAQRFRVLKMTHLKELSRVLKAVKKSRRLLEAGEFEGLSLKEGLEKLPYMTGNTRRLLMCAWCLMSSMSGEAVLKGPAEFFFKKLKVHNDVLSPRSTYSVVAMKDKTRSYVDALSEGYRDRIVYNAGIEKVVRSADQVTLEMQNGERQTFDKLILACNADQALALLEQPTPEEQRLLGAWKFNECRMVVHQDHSSFPKKSLMQAYTFLYRDKNGTFEVSVNGGLWYEPGVSWKCNLISSQHPNFPIDPKLVEMETVLRTPIFDFNSYPVIEQLPTLNGVQNTFYCGSYFGFGLHEDAVVSAVEVAKLLGVDFWDPAGTS